MIASRSITAHDLIGMRIKSADAHHIYFGLQATGNQQRHIFQLFCQPIVSRISHLIASAICSSSDRIRVGIGLHDRRAQEGQLPAIRRIRCLARSALGKREEIERIAQRHTKIGCCTLASLRHSAAHSNGERVRILSTRIPFWEIGVIFFKITTHPAGIPVFIGRRATCPNVGRAKVRAILIWIARSLYNV